jgi:hypothetical protein
MSCLGKRKDPEADKSESNNEKWMSRPKTRRVTSAFEASFESLKDGVLSSIEDKHSIREQECGIWISPCAALAQRGGRETVSTRRCSLYSLAR